MNELTHKVRKDFDRIALFSEDKGWNHNNHYHKSLLRKIPSHCTDSLEIGCGTGAFSRLLAERSDQVIGLDISPNMIQIAEERSRQYSNISFQLIDATTWDFPEDQFDCIASIATMHHLPLGEILPKMKMALKDNGVLVILDLYQEEGPADKLTSALAVPINMALMPIKNGRLKESQELREIWNEHGKIDSYLTLSRIHQMCKSIIPGARVKRHLFWRYSIVWKKPISNERRG